MYAMKSIANKGNIDEESLILYIICGIPDDTTNKTVLYDANTFNDLKHCFKVYQTMKSEASKKTPEYKSSHEKRRATPTGGRCVNCGGKGHAAASCTHKAKGPRCFNCSNFGHLSSNCPQARRPRNASGATSATISGTNQVNLIRTPELHVRVTINSKEYVALVDTGSDVTIITESILRDVSKAVDAGSATFLAGFGEQLRKTRGSCLVNLKIEGEDYEVRCHVVLSHWIKSDLIIGKDLLREATLTVANGRTVLKRMDAATITDENNLSDRRCGIHRRA